MKVHVGGSKTTSLKQRDKGSKTCQTSYQLLISETLLRAMSHFATMYK